MSHELFSEVLKLDSFLTRSNWHRCANIVQSASSVALFGSLTAVESTQIPLDLNWQRR